MHGCEVPFRDAFTYARMLRDYTHAQTRPRFWRDFHITLSASWHFLSSLTEECLPRKTFALVLYRHDAAPRSSLAGGSLQPPRPWSLPGKTAHSIWRSGRCAGQQNFLA